MAFGYSSAGTIADGSHQFAVVIYLPDHLDRVIAPLRERYDPDYSVIESHVTVVFPFQTTKSLVDVSRIIKRTVDTLPSIKIELDAIGDFYPGLPVIYWEIKKNAVIDELYKSLYAQLDLPIPHKNYCPHVTVAREISDHRVLMVKEKILPYLFADTFHASSIDLVAPTAARQWVSVRTFPLQG